MADTDAPQLYLITPSDPDAPGFGDLLARVLDSTDVACLRLTAPSADADRVARAADALREIAHARDVAIVIETHVMMVERHGLDGVHLTDGARSVRKVRSALGGEAIVGAFCGASRHDGMTAGETGADYVAFGPVGATGLGDGTLAGREIFEWWSEMIEIPVVAEGGLSADLVRDLAPVADFLAIGPEIWGRDDPVAELALLRAAMGR